MSIGQIVPQMSSGIGLEAAAPVSVEQVSAEITSPQASPFAAVLRDISPQGHAEQVGNKAQQQTEITGAGQDAAPDQQAVRLAELEQLLKIISAGVVLDVNRGMTQTNTPQKTEENSVPEVQIPQNVDMSAMAAELAASLQLAGRMPELQSGEQNSAPVTEASISATNAAEAATPAAMPAPSRQEVTVSPASAQPILQSQTVMGLPDTPPPTTVVAATTPVPFAKSAEPALTAAQAQTVVTGVSNPADVITPLDKQPSAANGEQKLEVVVASSDATSPAPSSTPQVVSTRRTDPVLDAYFQTSARPTAVSASVLQPIAETGKEPMAVSESQKMELAQPETTASVVTSTKTGETAPATGIATLTSQPLPVQQEQQAGIKVVVPQETTPAPAAPENRAKPALDAYYQASQRPVAPTTAATVLQSVAAVETVAATTSTQPEAVLVPAVAVTVSESAPAITVAPLVNRTAQLEPPSNITVVAENKAVEVPQAVAAPEAPKPPEAVPPAVIVTTGESTPAITVAPPVNRTATLEPQSNITVVSANKPAPVQTVAPATPAATVSAEVVQTTEVTPEPARLAVATPVTTVTPRDSGTTSRPAAPVPQTSSPSAALPPHAEVTPANRTAPVLDAYFQTSPRPATVAPSLLQPIVAAKTASAVVPAPQVMTSLPATPTAAATAVVPETVSPAVPAADVTVGESSQTVSKTALVSQPSTTVAAPAKALIPAAAETPEPVVAAAVTQTIASANRMTTAPLRNQEKVVQEIKPVSQGVTLETSVSEPTVTVTNAPVSETATLDAGGNPSGNGNNSAGQNQNGQAHQMAAQQHKTEPVSATGAAPAAREMHEPSKPEPMEQHILQQVKDQLAGRDFKPGSEQMFIRLTPNNLGELTLNLKMENQQLKIDIVADKSMVRDTLLKHVDSLRETLAKQNITMESFNVSTGSNGNQSGRNQNDWRELALQRQQNAWMASGGYRTQEPAVPTLAAAYQTRPEHAMVDLHF